MNELFIKRFELALSSSGMNASELSRKSGISEATISQYRSGYSQPKTKRLLVLANALNVDPAWLAGLNETQPTALDEEINAVALTLPENQKRILLQIARSLAENVQPKEE